MLNGFIAPGCGAEMHKEGTKKHKGFILERGLYGFGGDPRIFQLRCFQQLR